MREEEESDLSDHEDNLFQANAAKNRKQISGSSAIDLKKGAKASQ